MPVYDDPFAAARASQKITSENDDGSVSMSSNQGDEHVSLKKQDQEDIKVATDENRWVWYMRMLTTLVLVGVAVVVCTIVYVEGRNSEKNDFENDFAELGEKLVTSLGSTVQTRLGIVENFVMSLTSYVHHTENISWPFVTPPDFEKQGASVATLAQAAILSLWPRVRQSQLMQWNMYSNANQGWLREDLAHRMGLPLEQTFVRPIWPVLINASAVPPGPAANASQYFPVWLRAPAVNNSAVNTDMYSLKDTKNMLDAGLILH